MDGDGIQNECFTKKYQFESSQQASKFSIPKDETLLERFVHC